MFISRVIRVCSELLRTPEEILAFYEIPAALRIYRVRTHSRVYVNAMIAALAHYIRWCGGPSQCILPSSPRRILKYLKHARENLGLGVPAVIERLQAIKVYHYANDYPEPTDRDVRMYAASLRAEHTIQQAVPFDTDQILQMCAVALLKAARRASRDIALLLLSFAGAFRPSEMTHIRFEDLLFEDRGLRVCVRSSKNNHNRPRFVTIGYGTSAASCPVRALQRYLAQCQIDEGYVFRRIGRGDAISDGSEALERTAIGYVIKGYARAVGIPGKVSAYSTRRGCATTAVYNGASLNRLSDHLRHADTATTQRYVDRLPVPFEQSISSLVLP